MTHRQMNAAMVLNLIGIALLVFDEVALGMLLVIPCSSILIVGTYNPWRQP